MPIGACKENSGPISAGSCGAYNACCSNTVEIGEGQCNTAGQCSNCNGQGTTSPTKSSASSESSPTEKTNMPMTFAPSYYPSYVPTKTNSGKTWPHFMLCLLWIFIIKLSSDLSFMQDRRHLSLMKRSRHCRQAMIQRKCLCASP